MTSLRRLGAVVVFGLALVSVARAEGWKFWKSSSTPAQRADGTIGGAPTRSKPAESSWSMSRTLSQVGNGTKRAWNSTVDVVTLKSLRTPKPPQNSFKLGMHPDSRKSAATKSSGWFGSSKETSQPRTTDEFFSQERPQ